MGIFSNSWLMAPNIGVNGCLCLARMYACVPWGYLIAGLLHLNLDLVTAFSRWPESCCLPQALEYHLLA